MVSFLGLHSLLGKEWETQKGGGPLSQNWISQQFDLGKQIFQRMQEYDMLPVLPAFAGHIPENITKYFPDANVSKSADWGHFGEKYSEVSFLEPTDPLYVKIGNLFISKQIKLLGGTSHIYNADQFNEMVPRSKEESYLKSASKAMIDSMTQADPDAIWLMQAWLFFNAKGFWKPAQIEAYLSSPTYDQMIILDTFSESEPIWSSTDSYYGKQWIWCEMHEHGGNLGLYGKMQVVMPEPFAAAEKSSSMVGIGLTMEGINQNAVMYDLLTDHAWMNQTEDIDVWLNDYIKSRYGKSNNFTSESWQIMKNTVYHATKKTELAYFQNDLSRIVTKPGLNELNLWYSMCDLYPAWDLLLEAQQQFSNIDSYKNDIVDLGRELVSDLFAAVHKQFVQAYKDKNLTLAQQKGQTLLDLIKSDDLLLGTNSGFLLGKWLQNAEKWGNTTEEKELLRFNAKNQVTLWGPDGNINDYSAREWSGLVGDYYYSRWNLFIDMILEALKSGKSFDQKTYDNDLLKYEKSWQHNETQYPSEPIGDSFDITNQIRSQYIPLFETFCNNTIIN